MCCIGISHFFFCRRGGVNNFYTQINLSENYFFVGRHCSRLLHEKGVGGYMKEVKWSRPKKRIKGSQRVIAYESLQIQGVSAYVEAHLFHDRAGWSLKERVDA